MTTRRIAVSSLLAIALAIPFAAPAGAAEEASWKVIVNASNPAESISKEELARFFLKKKTAWPSGKVVEPVEPGKTSDARKGFAKDVLKKSPAALQSYWQQLVFAGREVPPQEKSSDADVISFVKAHENAIGYVSRSAPDDEGVKVLTISD